MGTTLHSVFFHAFHFLIFLSVCMSVYLCESVCMFVCLSVCLCLYVCLSVCASDPVCPFIFSIISQINTTVAHVPCNLWTSSKVTPVVSTCVSAVHYKWNLAVVTIALLMHDPTFSAATLLLFGDLDFSYFLVVFSFLLSLYYGVVINK